MPDLFHPLRVVLDGNEANCLHRVGSNIYAFEIIKAMAEITEKRRRNFHLTIVLAREPVVDMPLPRLGLEYKILQPRQLWTQFTLPLWLFSHQNDYDVFFTPGHYAPRLSSLPYISSVMDLAFLPYPQLFKITDLLQLESWTHYSVKNATKVIAISKFTKSEIIKAYHKSAADILVAYPAFAGEVLTPDFQTQKSILQEFQVIKPYFLYLGTLQPRKNIIRIIEAFEKFCADLHRAKKPSDYQLVLAGKNGWLTNEIKQRLASSSISSQIITTGFINEIQKAVLLKNAVATFNLGIYDGSGIPALESLAYGTLPLFARNTSLPEAVGAAGIGVNPFQVFSITKAMLLAVQMTRSQKKKFQELASKQLKKFSYQKSADQILSALYRLRL